MQKVSGPKIFDQVRTSRTTRPGPTRPRHQDSPPEQNPPGPRRSRNPPLRLHSRVSTATSALHASPPSPRPTRESAPHRTTRQQRGRSGTLHAQLVGRIGHGAPSPGNAVRGRHQQIIQRQDQRPGATRLQSEPEPDPLRPHRPRTARVLRDVQTGPSPAKELVARGQEPVRDSRPPPRPENGVL